MREFLVIKKYIIYIALLSLVLGGCKNTKSASSINLNELQREFLDQIGKEGVEESPFHFQYTLQTVFFSEAVISLFGELQSYDSLPISGKKRYESKTLCKIGGHWREVLLSDLFPMEEQREFLRAYCERSLKIQPFSYFAAASPLRERLEYQEISGFIVDQKGLVLFFQPYSVGKDSPVPLYVKIPYEYLQSQWNSLHPLPALLNQVISCRSYTAFWDELYRK